MCKYGTKFNMLAGHLAIRPFSPCVVNTWSKEEYDQVLLRI
jgi:hypothetical protein